MPAYGGILSPVILAHALNSPEVEVISIITSVSSSARKDTGQREIISIRLCFIFFLPNLGIFSAPPRHITLLYAVLHISSLKKGTKTNVYPYSHIYL